MLRSHQIIKSLKGLILTALESESREDLANHTKSSNERTGLDIVWTQEKEEFPLLQAYVDLSQTRCI